MAFRVIVDDTRRLLRGARRHARRLSVVPGRFKDYIRRPSPTATSRCTPASRCPNGATQDRGADPHARDARQSPNSASPRTGSTSRARRPATDAQALPLGARPARHPGARRRTRGIPRAHQARNVPGPGVLLHAQGRPDRAAARRHAGRLRLRGAHPGRRHLRRRQDQRPHACRCATQLQNGDQVEIITARGGTPVPAWERFVVTGKARARIRRFVQPAAARRSTWSTAARPLAKAFRQEGWTAPRRRWSRR